MKRIYLKRILSISLAAVMALNMVACGCGKKNKDAAADEEASHDATAYVFKDNPITCSECLVELMKRFEQEGIEIPYNKLVVYKGDKKED